MIIFKKVSELSNYLEIQRKNGTEIGFIPTMGALHDGHISLVKRANAGGNISICSIFINPTQFNDKKDFALYPVSIDNDIELLIAAECDILFLPDIEEVYPNGFENQQTYDFGYLETILEGASRPGHFKGVGQVVGRFFEIIRPNQVYLGQKDFQQCMIITRLAELMGLNETAVIICPTMREANGLAMSSRNRRLIEDQKKVANLIYESLDEIAFNKNTGNFEDVRKDCEQFLEKNGFVIDYIALADSRNLKILSNYDAEKPMVALIAAKIGDIRLIDNMLI